MNEYKNEYENYYEEIKRKYLGLSDEYEKEGYFDYLEQRETDIVPKTKVSYSKYAKAFAENNRFGNYDDGGYRRHDDRYNYHHRNSYDYSRRSTEKSNYFNVIMYEIIGVAILVFAVFVIKTSPIKELNLLYAQCKEVVKINGTLNVENTPVFKNFQDAISDLDEKMRPIDVDSLPQKEDLTDNDDSTKAEGTTNEEENSNNEEATSNEEEVKENTEDVDSSDASNL